MAELIRKEDDLNTGREKLNNAIKAFNETVVEGDSSVEAAQARVDSEGNTYSTLKERLDNKETEFSSQLAQKVTKEELNATNQSIDELDQSKASKLELSQKANLSDLETTDSRIDNLVANAGNTDGNAELLDIRVGFDGNTYDTAGEAIRKPVARTAEKVEKFTSMSFQWELGTVFNTGNLGVSTTRIRTTKGVFLKAGTLLKLDDEVNYQYGYNRYSASSPIDSTTHEYHSGFLNKTEKLSEDGYYVIFMRKIDDSDLTGQIDAVSDILNIFGNASLYEVKPERITDLYQTWKPCTILSGGTKLPEVDNNSKTLTFFNDYYDRIVYVGGVAYANVIPQTGIVFDLSTLTNTTAWLMLFDITTEEFVFVPWNQSETYKKTHALFATIRISEGKYNFVMPCPFLVDGKLYGVTDANNAVQNPLNANVKATAHRGYSQTAPENTLPAYELAKEMGFSYVECDIEWTSDGIPVLLHDDTIDRTSNGKGAISTMTLATAKTYDFGSWKGAKYTGTTIPTLEEFIILCKKLNLHPYLELKNTITSTRAQTLVNVVKKLGMIKNVTWISFSEQSLQEILVVEPTARVGITGYLDQVLIDRATNLKTPTNEVFINSHYSNITVELAEQVLLADFPIETWTVNDSGLVKGLVEKGVSGIATDFLNVAEIMSS